MTKPTITEVENAFQPAKEVSNATRFAGRKEFGSLRTGLEGVPRLRPKNLDPRSLPFPSAVEAYQSLGLEESFSKIEPPLHKEPQIRFLLLDAIRRFLAYLKGQQKSFGSALAFTLPVRFSRLLPVW